MHWGVDVSLWQDESELSAAQVNALAAAGCAFAIIRAGQPWRADDQLARHMTNFGNAGIPVGVYLWGDPLQNAVDQIDWYLSITDPWRNQIGCYCLDAEQNWADWTAYYRYLRGEIPWSSVPLLPPSTVSARYFSMAGRLSANAEKPVVVYSGGYFVRDAAAGMAAWLNAGSYPFWCANYRRGPSGMTGEQMTAYLETLTNPFCDGVDGWEVWQFSSGATGFPSLAGQNALDLNFIRDDAVFGYLFGGGTPPPPPQQTSYATGAVTVTGLRVRSGPGTGYGIIRIAQPGEVIRVRDFGPTTWIEINPGEWIAARYNGSQYVTFDELP
jgi:GH25 family lysozyme M1 (1,4-beta-N-acetylmuramidase)